MTKEYICYVGLDEDEIVIVVEEYSGQYDYYDSFLYLIEDVYNSCFTREYKTSTSLKNFDIIFQFEIKRNDNGNTGDSDGFLSIVTKSENHAVTDESKQYIQKLKEKLNTDNQEVEYYVTIDNTEPKQQTLLGIFELIFRLFLNLYEASTSSNKVNSMSDGERNEALTELASRAVSDDRVLG